jgi:hypothetical protein
VYCQQITSVNRIVVARASGHISRLVLMLCYWYKAPRPRTPNHQFRSERSTVTRRIFFLAFRLHLQAREAREPTTINRIGIENA